MGRNSYNGGSTLIDATTPRVGYIKQQNFVRSQKEKAKLRRIKKKEKKQPGFYAEQLEKAAEAAKKRDNKLESRRAAEAKKDQARDSRLKDRLLRLKRSGKITPSGLKKLQELE